jgi:hypothetical protein
MTEPTTLMKMAKASRFTACVAASLIASVASSVAPTRAGEAPVVQERREPAQTNVNREASFSNIVEYYFGAGIGLSTDKITSLKTAEEKEAFLEENNHAMMVLRLGLAHPFRRPAGVSPTIMIPHYSNFRALARLLVLEGEVKEGRGDEAGALNSYLDTIHFGTEIQRDGMILDLLVGNAIEAVGRKPLWPLMARLDADAAQMAARRLESVQAARPSFADVLRAESRFAQAKLQTDFAADQVLNVQELTDEYSRLMEVEIADAQRPYMASGQIPTPADESMKEFEAGNGEPETQPNAAASIHALFKIVKPGINRSRFQDTEDRAQNALLTVALALHAYKLENNRYPDSLAQLVPEYLNHIPTDPFARSEPLRYKRDGDKYILYSIGPDGEDDGGQAFTAWRQPAPRQTNVQANSKGDIVAGVNTQ